MGRHRLVGLASREQLDTLTTDYIEANTTPLNPAILQLTNPLNQISRRTFLDFAGGYRNYKDDCGTIARFIRSTIRSTD